jgi:very-short-patch-repair endonuclease
MRKSLTPQEARLWIQLRALRLQDFHFRRQAPFKGYYLDFVCFKSRLVIEADGGGHGEDAQAEHDLIRDRVLERAGFTTLRIWNRDIDTNLDGVVRDIIAALSALPPSPEVGRVDSPQASGVGKCGSSPDFADAADFPTPVASRLDPPTSGEGGR